MSSRWSDLQHSIGLFQLCVCDESDCSVEMMSGASEEGTSVSSLSCVCCPASAHHQSPSHTPPGHPILPESSLYAECMHAPPGALVYRLVLYLKPLVHPSAAETQVSVYSPLCSQGLKCLLCFWIVLAAQQSKLQCLHPTI